MSESTVQPAAKPALIQDKPRRRLKVTAFPNLIRIGSVVAFFIFWEITGRRADPLFMTYPSAIAVAFWSMTISGELPGALVATMGPFLLGMAISIAAGIGIGLLIGQFRLAEYILDPFLDALYAIPRVALVPLIMLWFGLGLPGKIVIVVSIAMFPIIVNTYAGVRDVRGALLDIGRAYAATEWQIFFKIILPAALPFIMAGVRLSVGLGVIGIIVAEFFTSLKGLGGLIVIYANQFATAKMFVPLIVIAVLSIALTQGVMWLERRLTGWRQSERMRE
jgi:ABC-type nitrate/sulfonate/bicarbonate transport system permease component